MIANILPRLQIQLLHESVLKEAVDHLNFNPSLLVCHLLLPREYKIYLCALVFFRCIDPSNLKMLSFIYLCALGLKGLVKSFNFYLIKLNFLPLFTCHTC